MPSHVEKLLKTTHVGFEYFEIESKNTLPESKKTIYPLVSIICPTYNNGHYIEDTIKSVLAQTYSNFEFIILDDGSTDNTRQIIQKYQHDSRVKYFYQENIGKYGLGEVLNRAIEKSKGELICRIDADDICLPNRLEKQVAQFQNDPELDLCFSDGFHIDAIGNLCSSDFRYDETFSVNSFNFLRMLFRKNIIPHPSVMFKKLPFFHYRNIGGEDYDLWLRAAPYFNFKFIDEKLIKYRFHEKSLSTSSANAKNIYSSTINILIETRQKYSIFDLYPEIYRCQIRHQALYSAYLDFGNTILTANVPVIEIAVKEYQKALKHFQGVEALNNLAIALYSTGEQQESLKIFEHLANHFGHVEVVQHNLNIVNALINGQQLSQANFALLTQSPESSELLQIIEELSVKNHPETSIVAEPVSLDTQKQNEPLVSIVVPCYNHAQYLPETVDSIIAQNYPNWECIIVNDGSTDNTEIVANQIISSNQDKKISLISKQNDGLAEARNTGISQSKGEFVLCVDADDRIHSNFLLETVKILQNNPKIGFVYTDIRYFGAKEGIKSDGDFELSKLLRQNQASASSLFRKTIFEQSGGFKKEMDGGLEDWEFWVAAVEQGWDGYRLNKPYLYYRQHHSGSMLQNLLKSAATLEIQKAKIIYLHQKLYTDEEVLWANQILQHNNIVLNQSLSCCCQLSKEWLTIAEENLEQAFQGELGKKFQELIGSGFRNNLFSAEEKQFIFQLNQYLIKGWKQDKIVQHFLSASLYCYPHQLPEKWFENAEVPEFLIDYFINFMFETPSFFKENGENYQYYQYAKDWVNFLHLCVTTETDSPIWQQMAWIFAQRANFIPLYFNSENLKEIYVKRAEIMEIALQQQGFQLDYAFSPRDKSRKKIRIGVLSNHFTPLTETFSSLPIFEYLDRGFETFLYTNMISRHPLEQYCESRVDRLVQLPEDLNAKVQAIRQDNLDFLFICTNTTAVTNQITILALHKLARVQIATFNSPVTTGIKNIDYYLTGKLTEFENSDHYSENLLLLNGQGYCFNYGDNQPKPTQIFTRQLFEIKADQTIFISAANFYKLTPELKETWVKILAKIDNSVLILMPFGQSWSNQYPKESLVKSLHSLFEKYNISTDRLKFFDPLPNRIEVREALKIADVYLDSYPYSGTTSLIEPLEIGLPSVVRQGNTLRNRMGAAMLQSIHLSDLVVKDEESYINLAVKLGTDEKLRKEYREQILEKMANNPPFLDSKAYSAQIGDVLKQLFAKHIQ